MPNSTNNEKAFFTAENSKPHKPQQTAAKKTQFTRKTKQSHFDTTHRPNTTHNTLVSSPNIDQTPSEDPTSRAIGGCRLS
jgi:hypothetical protein